MSVTYTMTINGEPVPGDETYAVINPATAEQFAHAPDCTRQELDRAVESARKAFPSWKNTSVEKRREYLHALSEAIVNDSEELIKLLTREQGKPIADATYEILGGAYFLSQYANTEIPKRVTEDGTRKTIISYEPLGVAAGLVPWNYPVIIAIFKLVPALLAGNTMVLKPAPTTPLTTLRIGEIANKILPAGVLNVISGGDRLGPMLTSHKGIDKISFTGSTRTGARVMETAALNLARVTLELGGNDAAIILPDVDLEAVAPKIFWAAFRNSGQVCICAKRIYIHEEIYEPLKQAIIHYANTLKIGDGSEPDTLIGPIQNRIQYDRVVDLIEDTKASGHAVVECGITTDKPGYFVPICIVDNPPEDARIVQEEPFGPIVPLLKFADVDEAIKRANATEYGLGASVWSSDIELACDMAGQLDAGTVWINDSHFMSPEAPFGGRKKSGFGIESAQEGLLEFMASKTIFVLDEPSPKQWFETP